MVLDHAAARATATAWRWPPESEDTVAVKVSSKGRPDATLYFSKSSGLLVKIERRGTLAGQDTEFEYIYSGHKAFAGVKMPTKELQKVNGRKQAELTSSDYSFPTTLDAKTFARPGK